MGMLASQARLLTITSRISDLELQAQSITNNKIKLSVQSQEVAEKYSKALNDKKLVFNGTNTSVNASNLTGYAAGSLDAQRILKTAGGQILVSNTVKNAYEQAQNHSLQGFLQQLNIQDNPGDPSYDLAQVSFYTNIFNSIKENGCVTADNQASLNSPEWLLEQLSNGNLFIEKWNASGGTDSQGGFESLSYGTDTRMIEEYDTSNDAAAEAEYSAKTSEIKTKDVSFDLDLKNIDTEHKALETEYDSVKKVIDKNVERSFKYFG